MTMTDSTSIPQKVQKRDGSLVQFDKGRIEQAIEKAAFEILQNQAESKTISTRVTKAVLKELSELYQNRTPHIEAIQDLVETALMSEGYSRIGKNYILYREKRKEIRGTKSALGLKDDLKLPIDSIGVLKKRYLLKDENRNLIETPGELFRRVALTVSRGEEIFKSQFRPQEVEEKFYQMMRNFEFIPNSPTLMNAGTAIGQLSGCFVLPVEDSIEAIFSALKNMAKIHQTGGGTGFSFTRLRPRGDLVVSTKGKASGPVSFMGIFDKATDVIVQGGRRRGANMGILRCDHPDIVEFIEAKNTNNEFSNFNLSVGVTDTFMEAVKNNRKFALINPRTRENTRSVRAKTLFDLIVNTAWRTGDPGLIFLDEINRRNPTPQSGRIEATNPCGEVPLLAYESCNLASINLARMVNKNSVNWQKLKDRIHWGIRFLDDVIEVNSFPLPETKAITVANRKIGLGVMGFADMLIRLGISYNGKTAISFAEKLMSFIHQESLRASSILAKERGNFSNFSKSTYAGGNRKMRNATVNAIAPTGTISIIAGCSAGIEPLFAISFVRNVLSGTKLFHTNPLFEEAARKKGLNVEEIFAKIAQHGSLQNISGVPRDMKRIFLTAFEITPRQHLKIQSAFQKYTDNAVSKTINLPWDATIEDVRQIYLTAHKYGCKGITVYRYGSKKDQTLFIDYPPGRGGCFGCPNCGEKAAHQHGTTCSQQECSKCETAMTRG